MHRVAEDGNGWILRLFEAEGTACRCRLEFSGTPCRIEQTKLLEETEALLLERGTQLDLTRGVKTHESGGQVRNR